MWCVDAHSCLTLCDPVDCSPPGSSVQGILQARTLGWAAMPSSGDLQEPGVEPTSPVSPARQEDSLPPCHLGSPAMLLLLITVKLTSVYDVRWGSSLRTRRPAFLFHLLHSLPSTSGAPPRPSPVSRGPVLHWLSRCPQLSTSLSNAVRQSVVQSLSRVRLFVTLDCSTPGLPVHHQLPEFTPTHVHRVGDAIQPSHPLSPPSPPAFNLSQHQGLFQWVSSMS